MPRPTVDEIKAGIGRPSRRPRYIGHSTREPVGSARNKTVDLWKNTRTGGRRPDSVFVAGRLPKHRQPKCSVIARQGGDPGRYSETTEMASPAGISRRTFNWLTAVTVPGFFATHGFGARADEGPADRLNLAAIGIGGRGTANIGGLKGQNIVARCDVDQHRAAKVFEEFPSVRRFTDFRKIFDAMEREIDGVVISTPDHTHFHPASWALERGKHVYLEKPLAHDVDEVRSLTEVARRKGLATQLGSQRHAETGLREGVELAR